MASAWFQAACFAVLAGAACAGEPADDAVGDGAAGSGAQEPDAGIGGSGGTTAGNSGCASLPPIGSGDFVRRDGVELRVAGRTFRAVGTNAYYLQELSTRAGRQQGDWTRQQAEVLDEAACRGLNVVRIWGYNDDDAKDTVMRRAPGDYVEDGLRGLDHAIAQAKARGLRVIVTLANNWNEYGGIGENGYARWAGKTHDDFFVDATMQGYWKEHATKLVNRVNAETGVKYADEPAIFAWEIANELRCPSCAGTSRLRDTVAELARHLKQLDPRHLVGDGGEGFDDDPTLYPGLSNTYAVRGDEGASYSALAGIPELDLLSYHHYPVNWGLMLPADHDIWIDRHEQIAKAAGKVAYLGEYGYKLANGARGAAADPDWAVTYDAWLARLFTNDRGFVAVAWQLVPTGGPYDDEFAFRRVDNPLVLGLLQRTAEALRR